MKRIRQPTIWGDQTVGQRTSALPGCRHAPVRVVFEYLVGFHAIGEHPQHVLHTETHPPDTGATAALSNFNRDTVQQIVYCHVSTCLMIDFMLSSMAGFREEYTSSSELGFSRFKDGQEQHPLHHGNPCIPKIPVQTIKKGWNTSSLFRSPRLHAAYWHDRLAANPYYGVVVRSTIACFNVYPPLQESSKLKSFQVPAPVM